MRGEQTGIPKEFPNPTLISRLVHLAKRVLSYLVLGVALATAAALGWVYWLSGQRWDRRTWAAKSAQD